MRGSARKQRHDEIKIQFRQDFLQCDPSSSILPFEETSKKRPKEKSGVTLVVIHLGIASCQRAATTPNPCLCSVIFINTNA